MTITIGIIVLFVIAALLMAASSIGLQSKIDLFKLGWAVAVIAFAFS